MSSATSTEDGRLARRTPVRRAPPSTTGATTPSLQPWHFFLASTALLAGVTAVAMRHVGAAALVLAVLTVGAAGYAAFMVFRTLYPLVGQDEGEHTMMLGGRTRAALERDKGLTLRAIKELEFDHAMGKVADADFSEMRDRLRGRALRLMRQLEGAAAYHEQIERDLEARLATIAAASNAVPSCTGCGTVNESDARFCKMCGHALGSGR